MNARIWFGLLSVLVSFSATAFQNEPQGFRDVQWGGEITSLGADFKKKELQTNSTYTAYIRSNAKLRVGPSNLKSIEYYFWEGQFFSVRMDVPRGKDSDLLLETLFKRFGSVKPKIESGFRTNWWWNGDATTIVFDCMDRYYSCSLEMSSTKIKKKKDFKLKQARKAEEIEYERQAELARIKLEKEKVEAYKYL